MRLITGIGLFFLLWGLVACQGAIWGTEGTSQPASAPAPVQEQRERTISNSASESGVNKGYSPPDAVDQSGGPATHSRTSTPLPPQAPPPSLRHAVTDGLLANVPSYAVPELAQIGKLVRTAFPELAPGSVQLLVLLTRSDEALLVVALDTEIDRMVTAGALEGVHLPTPQGLPPELDFVGGVIVSDRVTPMEPIVAAPIQVNQNPAGYAFKRVVLDTTYLFSGTRVKDAPPSFKHLGFGLTTDRLVSQYQEEHLTAIDPSIRRPRSEWPGSPGRSCIPPKV